VCPTTANFNPVEMHDFTKNEDEMDDEMMHYEEAGDFELDLEQHAPAPATFDDLDDL
jgi:hypothetical protein